MMNISWGTKIAALYIGFVLLIITMVTMAMRQKIDLVSDDYYARELVFQNKINEINNVNTLPEKVTHTIGKAGVVLQFPHFFKDKIVKGDIVFFRPSDASKDFKTNIQLNTETSQLISADKLSKGMYKMQLSWMVDGVPYFMEETVVMP